MGCRRRPGHLGLCEHGGPGRQPAHHVADHRRDVVRRHLFVQQPGGEVGQPGPYPPQSRRIAGHRHLVSQGKGSPGALPQQRTGGDDTDGRPIAVGDHQMPDPESVHAADRPVHTMASGSSLSTGAVMMSATGRSSAAAPPAATAVRTSVP